MKKIYTEEQVARLVEQAKNEGYDSGLEDGKSEMTRLYTKREAAELTEQARQRGYEKGWEDGFKRGYDRGFEAGGNAATARKQRERKSDHNHSITDASERKVQK